MAKLTPPVNFPFDKPTEWPDWKQRFERHRIATKLDKDNGTVQVSCLIYAMGAEAENIFKSFTFAEDKDKDDIKIVLAKLEDYFFSAEECDTRESMFSPVCPAAGGEGGDLPPDSPFGRTVVPRLPQCGRRLQRQRLHVQNVRSAWTQS